MGWQPGEEPGPDEESGPGGGLPGGPGGPGGGSGAPGPRGEPLRDARLAGFARGGVWDSCAPSAALAAVVEGAAGPGWRCPGAERDEVFGLLRRAAALESWAASAKLGLLRALMREEDLGLPGGGRHGDLPAEWSRSLTHEVAVALAMPAQSAEKLLWLAWDTEVLLPGIGRLLADGTLTPAKARAVTEALGPLREQDRARAEAMIARQLAGKTYGQAEKLAVQAAVTVDPGSAARRREDAERNRAKVSLRRGASGAANLSGYDLPADESLAAHAQVCARAAVYKDSGAFPGVGMDQLRARAYLDLLNGISAEARIAAGQPGTGLGAPGEYAPGGQGMADPDEDEPDPGPAEPGAGEPGTGEPGTDEPGTAPFSGTPDRNGPGDEDPGADDPSDDGPDDDGPDDGGPDDGGPDDDGPDDGGPDGPSGGPPGSGHPGGAGHGHGRDPDGERPRGLGGAAPAPPPPGPPVPPVPPVPPPPGPRLADLVFPLATLLGLAWRPGEGHGLGPLDPDLCRALAATAVNSPHSMLCVTVTDEHGYAIGHGCARPARGVPQPPRRSGNGPPGTLAALPARVNLTITSTLLATVAALAVRAEAAVPQLPGPGPGPGPGSWSFTRSGDHGPPGGQGAWQLGLPDGRLLTVELEPVPTFGCDHRRESHAYQPNDTLRHLVQVRDYECTFPPCSRHARESDFEHAVPYHRGGRTCGCNAGARSRQCHQVKQSPGWTVTQPRPGWHQWETPSGRVYLQEPKRYPF